MDWQSDIQVELNRATGARARGNEGQARVCARRAAGIAGREYFRHRGQQLNTSSAYDILKLAAEDASLPESLRQIAEHLTLRVDEEFKLPPNVDLIAETQEFCERLIDLVNS